MKIVGMLISVTLSCCSLGFGASESILSPNANLNRYSYVAMPPLTDYQEAGSATRADTMAFKELLSKLFQKQGLTVLQDYGSIDNLSPEKRLQTLWLVFGYNVDLRQTIVSLVLFDEIGQIVFSSTSKGWGGQNAKDCVPAVLKSAFAEFKKHYSGFDSNLANVYAEELREKFKDWETIDIDETALRNYFDKNISTLDPIEGIWILGNCPRKCG